MRDPFWGSFRVDFRASFFGVRFLFEPVALSHDWLTSRLSVAVMLPEEAVRVLGGAAWCGYKGSVRV